MEGENVKAYVATFKNHKPRHRVFCDSSSQLVMPMEGENVKAYVATFKNHKPRHRVFCDSSSQLVMPQ
ncbi:hypothetical protein ASE92_11900 [Pedobacter sp. Leaf41]|nr:hypothetical protein ASE92_11900 [Pedobacter sp. Leaf41]